MAASKAISGERAVVVILSSFSAMADGAGLKGEKSGNPLRWWGLHSLPAVFRAAFPKLAGTLPPLALAAMVADGTCVLTPAEAAAVKVADRGDTEAAKLWHAMADRAVASGAVKRSRTSPVTFAVTALLPPPAKRAKGGPKVAPDVAALLKGGKVK